MGVGRRGFLAAGVVVAFDPLGLVWVTRAQAAPGMPAVPPLDGELVTDPAALAEAAEDYGQIVHRTPRAVLRPGSVRDIVTMVRFANQHRITVAMRGQGHSTFGQAQAGVVIDSRTLAAVSVAGDSAVVEAGATWSAVVDAALAHGLTPPVATDYLGLSVGGTLSVGGIGGASGRHGLQVDTVRELEVVTGAGDLVRCSADRNRGLFEAVLGGLGQYALIVRARLALVPAQANARVYKLSYSELTDLTAAQRIAAGRFSYLEGQVVPSETGWTYVLEAASYHDSPPDDGALLAGLPTPAAVEITDHTYHAWLNRITDLVDQIRPLKLPNPWVNLFLPDQATDTFVADLLTRLTPASVGGGPILLYPVPRSRLTRPMVRVPDSDRVFLLSILRALPADDATVRALLADNRAAYENAVAVGGTQYPIGSIPTRRADWLRHYGTRYPGVLANKAKYDPRRVLTPGQRVFD